tara:strand:- start:83 stop:241 length:159 start_codon:yes stop_codon:yes gene_type:complete
MKKKEKGRRWDGRSRPSTDLYKKRWNEIFNNTAPDHKRTGTDKVPDKKESNV